MAFSKENSVVFNMNNRNRDIINDTHTELSEKLRLELESNESSLMINKYTTANFKNSHNYPMSKSNLNASKDKIMDVEINSSRDIIKPPKRGNQK